MANNCLVTTLKGSVNNGNISKLGEILLDIVPTEEFVSISRVKGSGCVLSIDDGAIYANDETLIGDSIELNNQDKTLKLKANSYTKLRISNKYSLKGFIEDDWGKISGKLEDFQPCSLLENLKITATGVIDNIGECVYLERVGFGLNCYGDIKDFVGLQISKGRTTNVSTGIVVYSQYGGNVQLNGHFVFHNSNYTRRLYWESTNKMYLQSGSAYVACLGYTDEEIAEKWPSIPTIQKCD